jgi:amino acid transporter
MSQSVSEKISVPADVSEIIVQEKHFHHTLGFWSLTATSFGGIIGSGWLFGAFYGASIAGPAALISWVIAAVAVALVSLVLIELGASRPEAGGSVRWPLYANGRIVGTTVGWTVVLGVLTDTEVLAVTQYLSHYWPWLYSGSSLSGGGIGIAAALEALLVVLNWYGIRLFARINLVVTWVKFIVPSITVIALFVSGFHGSNLTSAGGFAPYGGSAILTAITTGGLIYALNGFQPPVDLSGEARNPRRDIPRAILLAIGASAVLYILLQLAFLVAIPHSLLAHGWNGISFTSPFGQLALAVNLGWLSSLLYVDAVISPSGSEFVGTAEGARQTYALAKNRLLPKYFLSVPGRSGVPRRALLLNFIVGLLVLIPLHSWITLVTYLSDVFVLSYAVSAIAAGTFRSAAPTRLSGWIPGIKWIAPISFILSTELAYWSGWTSLRVAFPVTLGGVVLFFFLRPKDQPLANDVKARTGLGAVRFYFRHFFSAGDRPLINDIKAGAWLVAYLLVLVLFSGIGSYGGQGWIGQPYDSIIVAVVSLGIYLWAIWAGTQHIEETAGEDVGDSPAVSDALSAVAIGPAVPAQAGPSAAENTATENTATESTGAETAAGPADAPAAGPVAEPPPTDPTGP